MPTRSTRTEWMTNRKTTLIQKNPNKGTVQNNYRSITCLLIMWKILTAQIREEIYNSLTSCRLFPEEQKQCRKGSRGTELLYIDQHILNREQDQTEKSSHGLDWLQKGMWYGSAKLDDKRPQNIQNIRWGHKLYREKIKTWRVESTAGGRSLAETKIYRGIFQGDALSPLLFIIATMPLNHILRKCTPVYKLSRSQEKINHLMYMDDIKLFSKNEKELETLIHAVRIYSQGIGMEFGIEKSALLVMKSDKRHLTDGMELPNQDKIRTLGEKETYKYLSILKADTIKQVEIKEKNQKEYLRGTKKATRDKTIWQKLYQRNKYLGCIPR